MKTVIFSALIFFLSSSFAQNSQEEDFDTYMGKGTPHWEHVKEASDIAFLNSCKELYQQQKAIESQDHIRIPRTVHFIWLGPRAFPPKSVENIRTWIGKNPGWKFVFWTDQKRAAPCCGMEVRYVKDFVFSHLGARYDQSENWGERSDILRYEILFQEGGVYADHDANCLQPFDSLHSSYDLFCCLETPHTPFAGQNITCGNGVIGSKPNHPTIAKVLDLIDKRWDGLATTFQGKDHNSKEELVIQRTYIALTDTLKDCLAAEGCRDIVLPSSYFFAKHGMNSLFSKHFYANAWAENGDEDLEFEKLLSRSYSKIKGANNQFLVSFLVICAVSLISVVMLFVVASKVKQKYFS
ncbi:MAG: hypothetical protein EBZ47_03180 [Chlamydiae bacterium]|nr:hypothetical protein [Chlamydiota bacterium]